MEDRMLIEALRQEYSMLRSACQ